MALAVGETNGRRIRVSTSKETGHPDKILSRHLFLPLTVVAALNNMVRLTQNDDFAHARHADNLSLAGRKVNK